MLTYQDLVYNIFHKITIHLFCFKIKPELLTLKRTKYNVTFSIQYVNGSFTVELKYFRSMPWYKAIFLSNFFNFTLVLFRTLWYNRVG